MTSALCAAGTFTWTVTDDEGNSEEFTASIPFAFPENPNRHGYSFIGWGDTATSTTPVSSSWTPKKTDTLFAIWQADSCNLTWNANGGSGSGSTTQKYDEIIQAPAAKPTRTGYTFDGWYQDAACTLPLTNGTKVSKNQTFYAKWVANEYTITWNADYTGGTVTTTQQHYDEQLQIMSNPVREGYAFGGWYTGRNGSGKRAESYGTVDGNITFYAHWVQNVMDYTVTIDWDDHSDNDALRPESVTIERLRNTKATGFTYKLTADNAIEDGNKWQYTFENLAATDNVSNEYAYSVAARSSIPDEYEYKGDYTAQNAGYIIMTHKLITLDVDAYMVWNDASNQDGYRPTQITLQLLADGQPIADPTTTVVVPTTSGDTWTHTFDAMQRYRRTDDGREDIAYTIKVSETIPDSLKQYTISYAGGHNQNLVATLSHELDTVSKKVVVEWNDNNNQDGKRPSSMSVRLYADGEPVANKHVILSAANEWAYEWTDLAKHSTNGKNIVYSAQVTSTLVEYKAASTEMTIEMTYVPQSTSIPAFVSWVDDNDVDGLRTEIVEAELYADGVATGARQKMTAANNWSTTWVGYPTHKDGKRVEYTVQLTSVPTGYEAEYLGIYDQTGLSITLTHGRIRSTQTAQLVWDDNDNLAGARMSRVDVMLYADGTPLEKKTASLTEANGWSYDFADMPVYRDNGEEIKYSIYMTSARGDYTATTNAMQLTLHYEIETVDVPLTIVWDDRDNADNTRPIAVAVVLTIDGSDTKYVKAATAANNWSISFAGLAKYQEGKVGALINYGVRVDDPAGYTATIIGDTAVLKGTQETADVIATIHWRDNNDQYAQRPDRVTARLYADYHDGKGAVSTGKSTVARESTSWEAVYNQLSVNANGVPIEYTVQVSGDLANYDITYDGLDVYLTHKASGGQDYTTDINAKVAWDDNSNAHNSRPAAIDVIVYADGAVYKTYTLDKSDFKNQDTWAYTFAGLPTRIDGKDVDYSVGVGTALSNYLPIVNGETVRMVNVRDLVITVNWHDDNDADDKRPAMLELGLVRDGIASGDRISLTGDETADTWKMTFEDVPVWGGADSTHEIVYTYLMLSVISNYTINYNDYKTSSSQLTGDHLFYELDLTYDRSRADVTATVMWDDDIDRDGLRPETIDVELLADRHDGKGAVETGLTKSVSDSLNASEWTAVFQAQPTNDAQGQPIVYTLSATAPTGYMGTAASDIAQITFKHAPALTTVKTSVTWDHSTDDSGLTEQAVIAELYQDGVITGKFLRLAASNGYKGQFDELYVNHDHGTPYNYSVNLATKLPDNYEATTDNGTDLVIGHNYFVVSGTVVDDHGKPTPDAAVKAYDKDGKLLLNTSADNNGAWSFPSLPRGETTFRATLDNHAGSQTVAVGGKDITGVVITLDGNTGDDDDKFTYSASGKVISSMGQPANGAEIRLFDSNRKLLDTVYADASGAYKFSGLKNGTYQMSVVWTYDGKEYTATAETFVIYNNNTAVKDIVIKLPDIPEPGPDPCVVTGLVVDQNGAPLSGIIVQVKDAIDKIIYTLTTDAEGMYEQVGVKDGKYKVIYNYAGTEIASVNLVVNGEPSITLPTLVVNTTKDDGYGTISGTVTDKDGKPIEGANVDVFDTDGNKVGHKVTGPDGKYEFVLPNGDYTVVITKPTVEGGDHNVDVDDDHADGKPNPDGDTVVANKYSISGIVKDGETPLEDITVELYEQGVEPSVHGAKIDTTVTDADGYYIFTDLDEGEYCVRVILPDGDKWIQHITVGTNQDHADVTITTTEYTVSGVVTDKNGDPVEGATVTLKDKDGQQVGDQIITAADGKYEWTKLPEGQYTVTIVYPGSEDLGGGDVTVDGGGSSEPKDETHVVSGKVADQNGNALQGATVTLTGSKSYTATCNSRGVYSVAVVSGSYTAKASKDGDSSSAAQVKVENANIDNLNFTVTVTGGSGGGDNPSGGGSTGGSGGGGGGGSVATDTDITLSGTVTDQNGQPVHGADVTTTDKTSGKEYHTTTDVDGKWQITVPAGDYIITVKYGDTTVNTDKITAKKDTEVKPIKLTLGVFVKGYIKGYPDHTFRPEASITRAEIAAIISRVSDGFVEGTVYDCTSTDVPASAWYRNNLGFALTHSLLTGYPNGSFQPEAGITRGEFAAVVARYLKLGNDKQNSAFSDISGYWAAGYITQLAGSGVINGYADGTFRPDSKITRAEAVTMMNRALNREPDTAVLMGLFENGTVVFRDMSVGHWAHYQVLESVADHFCESAAKVMAA